LNPPVFVNSRPRERVGAAVADLAKTESGRRQAVEPVDDGEIDAGVERFGAIDLGALKKTAGFDVFGPQSFL
jgi:hypothetical protein